MQVPSRDRFSHETGSWAGPPWRAPVPGADFGLPVPDGEDGPDPECARVFLAFCDGGWGRVILEVGGFRDPRGGPPPSVHG